jgi:hypothetical protein
MIHFFESFKGPIPFVAARESTIISEFNIGESSLRVAVPDGGGLTYSGAYIRSQHPAKRGIEPADVLAIGYSLEYKENNAASFSNQSYVAFTPAKFSTLPDASQTQSANITVLPVLEDQLPVLCLNPSITIANNSINKGLSLRTSSGGIGSSTNTLWNEELPGINFFTKHFYEIVYDFVANKISVWVDNVQVGVIDYTFTAAQKAMRIRLRLDISTYFNTNGSSYPVLNGMYTATERLGPVSWGLSKPTADSEVSAEFTPLPGWSKVNIRQDGAGNPGTAKITTTKSKQKALFKGSAVIGEVLAISVRGRFSSTEQSALEAFGAVKTTIKSNGQEVQQDALAIPKQSYVAPIVMFEKSPFTGATWTAAELTAMTYGAEIVVTPKTFS